MKNLRTTLIVGFLIGAFVPLIWGVLSFMLFNLPESWFSRVYWDAVYITCPFWGIDGVKALILMPLLNGALYSVLAAAIFGIRVILAQHHP
jgi:hypothetical protein